MSERIGVADYPLAGLSLTFLALVIAGGLIARSTLPEAPDTYAAMIQARSG